MGTIARQALPNFPFGQATTGMSANPAKSGTELVVCRHGSIGHLVESPKESVVRDPLGSGEVAEESVAGEQASPFQIQQNRGVGDDDGHGSVIFCSVAVMCWEADTSDRLGHGY